VSDETAPVAAVPTNSAETGSNPVEPAAPEPEATEDYEVDGKKITLTATQRRTAVQKGFAADKRIQTATETQKKLDALIADFEKDPEATLSKLGKNPEKILADLLERKAKQALLTPEQREAADLKEKLATHEADKAKREKADKEREDAKLDAATETSVENDLIAVANKFGLDATPAVLEELCDAALHLMDMGIKKPSVEEIGAEYQLREDEALETRDRKLLPRLKGPRLLAYIKSNVGALLKLPANELLEALGPEGVKTIQAATLTKVPTGASKVKAAVIAPPPRNGAGRFISEGQFDAKKFR
jgi:hypothetical protein